MDLEEYIPLTGQGKETLAREEVEESQTMESEFVEPPEESLFEGFTLDEKKLGGERETTYYYPNTRNTNSMHISRMEKIGRREEKSKLRRIDIGRSLYKWC